MISSRPDLAAVLAFGLAALFTALIVPVVRRLAASTTVLALFAVGSPAEAELLNAACQVAYGST